MKRHVVALALTDDIARSFNLIRRRLDAEDAELRTKAYG